MEPNFFHKIGCYDNEEPQPKWWRPDPSLRKTRSNGENTIFPQKNGKDLLTPGLTNSILLKFISLYNFIVSKTKETLLCWPNFIIFSNRPQYDNPPISLSKPTRPIDILDIWSWNYWKWSEYLGHEKDDVTDTKLGISDVLWQIDLHLRVIFLVQDQMFVVKKIMTWSKINWRTSWKEVESFRAQRIFSSDFVFSRLYISLDWR